MISATIIEAVSIIVFIIPLTMIHYIDERNDAENAYKKIY